MRESQVLAAFVGQYEQRMTCHSEGERKSLENTVPTKDEAVNPIRIDVLLVGRNIMQLNGTGGGQAGRALRGYKVRQHSYNPPRHFRNLHSVF